MMGENSERLMYVKKKVLFSLILSLLISSTAWASSAGEWHGFPLAKVQSNGKTLITDTTDYSPPVNIDGHVYVPLYMLRQAGMQVTWDANTSTVDAKVPHQLTDTEIAEISKSVGLVYVYKDGVNQGQGSGFVANTKVGKVFLTNCHVGCIGDELRITLNGKQYTTHDVLFKNEQKDLYGVRLDADVKGLEYRKDMSLFSTFIWAIGYPHGKYQVSKGFIDASLYNDNYIGHNAKSSSGSSGGPIVDDNGVVQAITSAGATETINEAIPTYYLQQELDKLNIK